MKPFLVAAAFLLMVACERELSIDYRTAEPLYVAEVLLTTDEVTARVTTTRGVMQSADGIEVNDAVVTIRPVGTEWTDTLMFMGRGRYRSGYFAVEGKEYEANISLGGRSYTSTSVMPSAPVVNSYRFVWQDVMTERVLLFDLRLQDPADEHNYYFMHLYRNGIGYRWAVADDSANPGAEVQQLFTCTTKRDMDADKGSDVLHEGDRIRLEVRSIDVRTYEYLYSLQLMGNTGTNPIANFSGGMLGYFSAYQSVDNSIIFHVADVEEQP